MKKLAGILLLAPALFAAEAPGTHIPFEKYKLGNGMRVVLARDTTVPLAAVYLTYEIGSRSEAKGQAGFAQLCVRLLVAGSPHLNGLAHLDYTEFSETLTSNQLGPALWREADRLRSLKITEESLRAGKESIETARRKTLTAEPYQTALQQQWPAFIYSDFHNAHGAASDADDVKAATVDDVAKFFRTWYAPNNAVLVVSGDFESADARKLIAGSFGAIPAQPAPKRPEVKEPPRAEGKTIPVQDPAARAPAVIVGWPAPSRHSPDWYAISMLDAVLTSGEMARLKLNMMKSRLSLMQGESNLGFPAASSLDFKDPSYYTAFLIYRPNFQAHEIVSQYQSEIDRIAQDGVGRSELERFRTGIRFSNANALQTSAERARILGIHELLDGDAGFAEKDEASLLSVTAEQIQAAARKYLTAGRRDVMAIEPPRGAK